MKNSEIDAGKSFDWGKASKDYARYRDIYPQQFYEKLHALGVCTKGQTVLDLGTGTGVLPRNMAHYGAQFIGIDSSKEQIFQAQRLAEEQGLNIPFQAVPAEQIAFDPSSFDAVTACQCFFYFDLDSLLPKLSAVLKPQGRLAVLYMAWLPEEDPIAAASEKLILQFNPVWSGAGETRRPIPSPSILDDYFEQEQSLVFDLRVPFTRETWNGRMKACRGIGASLNPDQVQEFEREHLALLEKIAPEQFEILHYAAMAVWKKKTI